MGNEIIFKRSESNDGSVAVTVTVGDVTLTQVIDKNHWHSIIAQVSYYGEEDYGFYRAANFHSGEPIHETCPLIEKDRLWK